jgi:hypothetical protein
MINRRHATAKERMLIVRHSGKQPYRFSYFLQWIERELPAIRACLELRLLPCRIGDLSPYVLCVPWLQDPVADWTPRGYRQAIDLAARCAAAGIPVLNGVDRTARSVKSECTRRIASAGVRTPRIVPIRSAEMLRDALGELGLPLLVREDRGHGQPALLVETRADVDRVRLDRFAHPVAAEFIDVRSSDGLYRKYRYLAAGEQGVARHLMIGDHWEVRTENRVRSTAARAEERAFLETPDPNRDALERARRALEFDLAAFDYSYDRAGRLVVWEANPYPDLSYPEHPSQRWTFPFVERSFAAVVRLYLETAQLPVPAKLDDLLAGQGAAELARAA